MRRKIFLGILVILESSISLFCINYLRGVLNALKQTGLVHIPQSNNFLLGLTVVLTIINIILFYMVVCKSGKEDSK